jgi:hypothetical protein
MTAAGPQENSGKEAGKEEDPPLPLPTEASISTHLEKLVETAKDYARGAKSAATLRAYASDWRHYEAWCRRKELEALPPSAQVARG